MNYIQLKITRLAFFILGITLMIGSGYVHAQDQPPTVGDPINATMADTNISNEDKFNEALKSCRFAIKASRRSAMYFYDKGLAEATVREKDWKDSIDELREKAELFRERAIIYFLDESQPNKELLELMTRIAPDLIKSEDKQTTLAVYEKLRTFYPDDIKFQRDEALIAVKLNDFDRAIDYVNLGPSEVNDELEDQDKGLLMFSRQMKADFEKELAIRAKEAAADDLPRVEFKTIHGDFVIELFENEAPETVANFIYLVELGFYDGTYFHGVLKDFLARGGAYTKQGAQECGYRIKDEMKQENARKHFRGSISMFNLSEPNTADNQFILSMVPTPLLDWDGTDEDLAACTVFGHVISGMEVVDKLNVTCEIDDEKKQEVFIQGEVPDEIVKATVLRKRDHEYKPTKITDEEK